MRQAQRRMDKATKAREVMVRAEDSEPFVESAETATTKAPGMHDPVGYQPVRRSWWRRLLDRRPR